MGFSEVSGLNSGTDAIEYREGNSKELHKIKIPGLHKFNNITLKRGILKSEKDYSAFVEMISLHSPSRKDLIIQLLNESHQPVVTWKVKRAFPVKVQAPDLKASGNEVAIEVIELAHEGIEIAD